MFAVGWMLPGLSCANYPAAGTPRRLLVGRLVSEEEEVVCCVSQVACASSVRTDAVTVERTACLGWLSVLVGPAVACARLAALSSPPSSLAPTSGAAALLQGEEDVDPGAVDLSNPAVRQG